MSRFPEIWRNRLPSPQVYFGAVVPDLTIGAKLGIGTCPFHGDCSRSLTVKLSKRGHWDCRECGQGDMVAFHMRLRGLEFRAAVSDLTGLRG